MERRQIRKRWQITIPRDIRQRLNFFQGQVLNWDLVEDSAEGFTYIRIYSGAYATRLDQLAAHEISARKDRKRRQQRCGRKIRKSDTRLLTRERRVEAIKSPKVMDVTELQELVSMMSSYLQSLQERLSKSPGEF